MLRSLPSRVRLFVTPRTVAHQAPLSIGILQARILEWVAMPSSGGSSQPRDRTQVSYIAGRLFTIWATKEEILLCFLCFFLCFYAFFPCDFNSQCNSISNLHSSDLTFLLITRLIHIPSCLLYLASWHAICRLACSGKISLRKRIPSIL